MNLVLIFERILFYYVWEGCFKGFNVEMLFVICLSYDVIIKGYRVKYEKFEILGNVFFVFFYFLN